MKKGSQPTIGVALSGGGARGFAHVGALRALDEAGIPIHFLAGTSVGSVVGAAFASGTSLDEMLEIFGTMRWRDVAKLTVSRRGLASIERANRLLDRLIKVKTFEELRIPFYAVATDIRSGETIVLSHGDLKTALRASCAIPGLFVPVEVQGRQLVDGGLTANLPVIPMRQLGVEKIIAVDVSARIDHQHPPQNMFQIILQSMFILGHNAGRRARESAHVLVEPHVQHFPWDDFEHCIEIAAIGEQAMHKALPQIQAWIPREKRPLWKRVRAALGFSKSP